MANLLLISNSTNAGEAYLEYAMPHIEVFLTKYGVKSVLFVPYAGVTISWDEYTAKVRERFEAIGVSVTSVADVDDAKAAVESAEAIVVGGGNTFNLLKTMQESDIVDAIKERVGSKDVPYIGWSAGSVVASPTMCTTNDMPIVEPLSFKALNLVGYQINPHYTDQHPVGHAGETRDMRIAEYVEANRDITVVGIFEGSMLHIEGTSTTIIGGKPVKIFKYGGEPYELSSGLDEQSL